MMLRRLTLTQLGALSMLTTAGRDGATQPLLSAHGFSAAMIARLVNRGLATVTQEKVRAGEKVIEVGKVRITDAGRDALAAENPIDGLYLSTWRGCWSETNAGPCQRQARRGRRRLHGRSRASQLRAYKSVYPKSSRRAAETGFGRLLKNAEFSARIAELAEQAAQGAVMAARDVLEELSRIGRANMLDYLRAGPDGDPVLDWSRLTRDQAAALIEVTVEDFLDGRGENAREVRRVRFKLASKIDALELLGKHHKLYVERHVYDFGAGIAERLAAAIARVDGRARSTDSTQGQACSRDEAG
jgi:phage terminase small subunit